jgi:hypothetical protein
VAEAGEEPPLRHLDRDLDLRFVPRALGPGGDDDDAVVLRELLVGALEARLVATGGGDAALELIAHDDLGDAAEEGERALVAADPVVDLLGARGFGVGVAGGAEHGHEELDLGDLAGGGIDERRLLARVVDEELLAGAMNLPHGEPAVLEPPAVDLAVLSVAVPVRVLLEVLEVEQRQGDARLASFAVDVGAVRPRPAGALGDRDEGTRVEPGLQRLLGQRLDAGPVQPRPRGPLQDDGDGAEADAQAFGHLPVGPAQDPLLAENLADLSHG